MKMKDTPETRRHIRARLAAAAPLKRVALQRFRRRTVKSVAKELFVNRDSAVKPPPGLRVKIESEHGANAPGAEVFEVHPIQAQSADELLCAATHAASEANAKLEIYVEDERIAFQEDWPTRGDGGYRAGTAPRHPPPAGVVEEMNGASYSQVTAPKPLLGVLFTLISLALFVFGFLIIIGIAVFSKEGRTFIFSDLPKSLVRLFIGHTAKWRLFTENGMWRISATGHGDMRLNPRDVLLFVALPNAWQLPVYPRRRLFAVTQNAVIELANFHDNTEKMAAFLQSRAHP